MKNSPTFSIIVPACNTALYAKQLVTSLQAQTMPDFECIFVSETSTDNTFEVLSQLIRGDDRFQIVSLPCSGSASVSRNYGIDHAKNDYLLFVDGDDWIEPESLAYFREKLMTTGEIDLLAAAATVWLEKTNEAPCKFETLCPALPTDQILNGKNALAKLYSSSYRPATWLYVYR